MNFALTSGERCVPTSRRNVVSKTKGATVCPRLDVLGRAKWGPYRDASLRAHANIALADEILCAAAMPNVCGGQFVEDRTSFVEQFRIRGYEVGPDRRTTITAIANILQECASNHAICLWGKTDEGFATDPIMVEKNLLFVMTRLQIQMIEYPKWGEVIDVETFFSTAGRAAGRRDWVIRDSETGEVLANATSTWVLLNSKTRRLARIPEEMKEKWHPFGPIPARHAIPKGETKRKLPDFDALDVTPGPVRFAGWSYMDMNGHINNVAYLTWALDTVPQGILNSRVLKEIEMDFKAECNAGDRVESKIAPTAPPQTNGSKPLEEAFLHSLVKNNGEGPKELIRMRTMWSPM